jgi:hypothetical protein
MGVAPPPDGPPLAEQEAESSAAGFAQQPAVPALATIGADIDLGKILPTQTVGGAVGGTVSTPEFPDFCGFSLPTASFSFGFVLPTISFPPELPDLRVSLGINCSLSNPVNISAGVPYGGGRVGSFDPDPDAALDAST